MFKKLLFLTLFLFSQWSWAQDVATSDAGIGPKKQIATIVYMGLAGAVLGLSTLSFYGRPQDHQSNIAIGFGVGVVVGTIYMTYNAATNPSDFYSGPSFQKEEDREREMVVAQNRPVTPFQFSYRWSF